MSQVFHPATNAVSRISLVLAVAAALFGAWLTIAINRSDYVTQAGVARDQPVPFSHAHHVADVGIDCRYCHSSVERSSFAGIPPTKTCMNCHTQLFADTATLAPVRESFQTGRSIVWTRVHDLPDFVYFDHSVHIHKGVGCVTCHGQVEQMPLIWQVASLQMEWCLGCHRNPAPNLRPRKAVFRVDWTPKEEGEDPQALGARLMREYDVQPRTDCSTCHR